MTRAQEYVYDSAIEQKKLAKSEIKRLYKEFYKLKKDKTIPLHFGVLEGAMHTIGYWEGVKSWCGFVIDMLKKNEGEFSDFLHEQKMIELHNERMKKEMKEMFKDLRNDRTDDEK